METDTHTDTQTHTHRHRHTHTQADLEFGLVIAHGQMNMATTISNLSIASATYESLHTPTTKVE